MDESRYCAECKILVPQEDSRCSRCGGRLRVPQGNDPVFLCRVNATNAMMLEPLLTQAGIPYSKVGRLGAALVLKAGSMLEEFTFFVPASTIEEARALPFV